MTVPQAAARRVPLAVAACAARRAAQFRLRQCNAMQVRSPSRYEYIPVTWGIKIAEFLVEMELFPQIRNQMGSNSLIHSWLIISPKTTSSCMITPVIQYCSF